MGPIARTDVIMSHSVEDELVLYDRERQRAHRLNSPAARVYRLSDGSRSVGDMVSELSADPAIDERVVHAALRQLSEAGLLEGADNLDRRNALKKVAVVAAALAVPVVESIAAPTPAMAQSAGCPPGTVPVSTNDGTVCVSTGPTQPE